MNPDTLVPLVRADVLADALIHAVSLESYRVLVADWLDEVMDQNLASVVTCEDVLSAIRLGVSPILREQLVLPLMRASLDVAQRELLRETRPVGHFVEESARANIEALLARPRDVDEKLLRRALEHPEIEALVSTMLFDGWKEFYQRVNPITAEWGLSGLLKKLMPFGLGGASKLLENVRAEFDKRWEPEMKKFVAGFSGRALRKAGDSILARRGSRESAETRRTILAWLYEQSVSELLAEKDPERQRLSLLIATSVVGRVTDETAALREHLVRTFFEENGSKRVADVLRDHGIELRAADLATLTYPEARAILSSKALAVWLTSALAASARPA